MLDEENRFGPVHPRDAAIPDAALLLCAQLRDQITAGVYPRGEDDTVFLTRREFQHELVQCRGKYGDGWGRRLRELPLEKLVQELAAYMAAGCFWRSGPKALCSAPLWENGQDTIPPGIRAGLERRLGMNRWKMNKLGFVNFWLYDHEEFQIKDGHILLRGDNASGKSITTQSFIPFLLDGNKSPERLDPFGSQRP